MSIDEKKDVIEFGSKMTSEQEQAYRNRIAGARGVNALKGQQDGPGAQRLSGVPLMQRQVKEASARTPEGGVQPRPPGSPLLSQETASQLQALEKVQQAQLDEAEVKREAEKAKDDDLLDVFDFAGRSEAERVLNNKQRRKGIEGRCEPMRLSDLIMRGEVQQTVPIVPDEFEVRLRSFNPEETLFIKDFMATESEKKGNKGDHYALEKYSLCQLACSLVAVNGKDLPEHRDANGEPQLEAFQRKLRVLTKMSAYVIADLMLNFAWFDIRVRRLLNADEVKNG